MQIRIHIYRLFFLTCALVSFGCTQKTEPPQFERDLRHLQMEECNHLDFNLEKVSTVSVRNLVACLNGKNHALQEYQDLLSSLTESELQTLVNIYNLQLAKDHRVQKLLHVLSVMKERNLLGDLYHDLEVVIESKVAENFLYVIQILAQTRENHLEVDPQFIEFQKYIAKSLQNDQANKTEQVTQALAKLISSSPAKSVAKALSAEGGSGRGLSIQSDQVIDFYSAEKNQFVFQVTSKPNLHFFSLLFQGAEKQTQAASFLADLSQDRNGSRYANDLKQMVLALNEPIICLEKNNSSRRIDHMMDAVLDEVSQMSSSKQELENFFLSEAMIHFSVLQSECKLPNKLISSYQEVQKMIEAGHSQAMYEFIKASQVTQNSQYFLNLMKHEDAYSVIISYIQELEKRGALSPLVRLIGNYLSPILQDFISSWGSDAEKNSVLHFMVEKLRSEDEKNATVKLLMKSLIESFAVETHGVGDLLATLVEGYSASSESFAKQVVIDLLSDQSSLKQLDPIILKVIQNKTLAHAMDLTAKLAKNNELDRLVQFFIDLSRRQGSPGAAVGNQELAFAKDKAAIGLTENSLPAQPAQAKKYSACTILSDSLFAQNGNNLIKIMDCANYSSEYGHIVEYLNGLKSQGWLGYANQFYSDLTFGSPFVQEIVDQMVDDYKSGEYKRITDTLHLTVQNPALLSRWQEVIEQSEGSRYAPKALEAFSILSQDPRLADWLKALKKLKNVPDKPVFKFSDVTRGYDDSIFLPIESTAQLARTHLQLLLKTADSTSGYQDDLDAFANALKTIANDKKIDFAGFLQFLISKQSTVSYYKDDQAEPVTRVVTPLEQLDIFVVNADLSVASALPIWGVDHVGTFFQMKVAESANLEKTLNEFESILNKGILYTKSFGMIENYNHLMNLKENFFILRELNQRGYLAIFQKIYQNLIAATPKSDRKQDPRVNHAALAHSPMHWGLLTKLVGPLMELKMQGALPHFSQSLQQLMKSIQPAEVNKLRSLLILFQQKAVSGAEELDYFEEMWKQMSGDQKAQYLTTFTTALMVLGESRSGLSLLNDLLLVWMSDPNRLRAALQNVNSLILRDYSRSVPLKYMNAFLSLDQQSKTGLFSMMEAMQSLKLNDRSASSYVFGFLFDNVTQDSSRFFIAEMEQHLNDLISRDLHPLDVLTKPVYIKVFGAALKSVETRRFFIVNLETLAKQRKITPLAQEIDHYLLSTNFSRWLFIAEKYLTKGLVVQ